MIIFKTTTTIKKTPGFKVGGEGRKEVSEGGNIPFKPFNLGTLDQSYLSLTGWGSVI